MSSPEPLFRCSCASQGDLGDHILCCPGYRAFAVEDGLDGRSPDIRGTYDANESYAKLDVVALDGAAFIAKHDNPGVCPGNGWQLMSKQGRQGRPGQPGERGIRGEKGEKGDPSEPGPRSVSSELDDNYNLIRTMSDGSRDVIPLRAAFEKYHREVSGE